MSDIGQILGYLSTGAAVGAVLFGTFGRKFLDSYLSEKGKNLATREDIEKVTDQIEAIKAQYALLIEETRSRNQMRLAAVDKRLQAHQEAYSLWRKLVAHVHNEEIGEVVLECQTWWDQNCLYLSESSRDAFHTAYSYAFNHKSILADRSNAELAVENFEFIMKAGPMIVEDVALPSLGESESAIVGQDDS